MAKVIICFILTCVFSFLSFTSFMSNDYWPIKEWIAYYTEYKALQSALQKGDANKAEILAKLKALYPERAGELEAKFKEKYGDLKNSAQDTQDSVQSSLRDTLSKIQADSEAARASEERDAQAARDKERSTMPSRSSDRDTVNTPAQHDEDHHDTAPRSSRQTDRNQQ